MVNEIRCSQPASRNPTDLVAGIVLKECATDDEVVKLAEVYKPFAVVVTVTKPTPPYHMLECKAVRTHLGVQITNHYHYAIFRKPLPNYVQLPIESILVLHCSIAMLLNLDRNVALNVPTIFSNHLIEVAVD